MYCERVQMSKLFAMGPTNIAYSAWMTSHRTFSLHQGTSAKIGLMGAHQKYVVFAWLAGTSPLFGSKCRVWCYCQLQSIVAAYCLILELVVPLWFCSIFLINVWLVRGTRDLPRSSSHDWRLWCFWLVRWLQVCLWKKFLMVSCECLELKKPALLNAG